MNEFDFIARVRRLASERGAAPGVVRGIGDDAAVLKSFAGSNVVVSTDLLIEDVDFQRETTPPDLLGHKALAVSLSDIAAMGARPRWTLLSIGVPEEIWNSGFLDSFYAGFFQLAKRYGITLIGGDISRTMDKIVIDSIVLGETAKAGAVFRSGAEPGDQIFVTGFLGDAAAGLRLIARGAGLHQHTNTNSSFGENVDEQEAFPLDYLLLRQLQPEPRVGWGLLIGEQQLASAMIDVSDGLSSDLNHLCTESQIGALIDAAAIPINPLVTELSGRRALDPLMLALHGGEDFELLFTVNPRNVGKLPKRVDGISLTRIGEIKAASEAVRVLEGSRTWQLEPGGWQHFRTEGNRGRGEQGNRGKG
ncbi:MAG TPA: thiamine-phosphate kinase [Pyrinomonadaceae bacterium]|nr:thiamine-phosphate kinase [Pyrinomonadaceae bacterium]